jgi:hypothetical protein
MITTSSNVTRTDEWAMIMPIHPICATVMVAA